MRTLLSIFFLIVLQYSSSAKDFGDKNPLVKDTLVKPDEPEDETIDEILKSRELPKKEKIQYLSQETKYGFKNLFKNYS